MSCEQIMRSKTIQEYLWGRLSAEEQEAFELHYFDCPRCAEKLSETIAVYDTPPTEAQQQIPVIRSVSSVRATWRWGWAWAGVAATLLIAVGLSVWLSRPATEAPGTITVAPAPEVSPLPANRAASLVELAQFQPPPYTAATLRGPADEATQQFRAAMQQYMKGRYGAAISGLRAAAKLNPKAADAQFYLGTCYLLTTQTDSAIPALKSTIALGESPYLEDAHYFLAKAYLHQVDLNGAQRQLKATIQLRGEHEREARELLQRVETLSKSPR